MSELNIDSIVSNIRQKLGLWDELLWTFTSSGDMKDIVRKLVEIKSNARYFVPSLPDALHIFSILKPSKVRCIILTSLKSSSVDLADGNKIALQPNTETIRAVLRTISDPLPNVFKWVNQGGVLQICTTPTSTLDGEPHTDIWKSWNAYIINRLNDLYPDIPWIIIGRDAEQYRIMIKSEYKFIINTWPVNHNDSWNKVNEVLVSQDKKPIVWNNFQKKKGTITKYEAKMRKIDRYYRSHLAKQPQWYKDKKAKNKQNED